MCDEIICPSLGMEKNVPVNKPWKIQAGKSITWIHNAKNYIIKIQQSHVHSWWDTLCGLQINMMLTWKLSIPRPQWNHNYIIHLGWNEQITTNTSPGVKVTISILVIVIFCLWQPDSLFWVMWPALTNLALVPHICVSESGQHGFR